MLLATVCPVNASVSGANKELASNGKTKSGGGFSTGKLEAAKYVLRFISNTASGGRQLLLGIVRSKQKAIKKGNEDNVRNIASIKVDNRRVGNVKGQVPSRIASSRTDSSAPPSSGETNRVKKINTDKRYVWMEPVTGSRIIGGGWTEVQKAEQTTRDLRRPDRTEASIKEPSRGTGALSSYGVGVCRTGDHIIAPQSRGFAGQAKGSSSGHSGR